VNVIDKDGKPFTENVGNGSVCTLKLFGYRNQEGQVVVTLDTVQVLEHVAYEQKAAADSVDDDVLGVSYKVKKVESKQEEVQQDEKSKATPKGKKEVEPKVQPAPDFDESEELPF